MAQIDVYPAAAAIDFNFQKDSPQHMSLASDQHDMLLSVSPPGATPPGPEVSIAGLPPLLRGHPDTHLHAGIIRAFSNTEPNAEHAFFAADLSVVYAQHERWRAHLPDIEPFFAVKSNPDPYVLRLLAGLGTGFDCASHGEISQVLELGVDPARVVFANPCKPASFVRAAAKAGVDMMTFDNADELHKVARAHPRAKLIVRILTDDSKSLCRLGLKFGAPLASVPGLLAKARELGLDVVGVSFHVGSGCFDAHAFGDAVLRARAAFDMGRAAGYAFELLDVGGGFEDGNFEHMAAVLRDALDVHFPDRAAEGLRLIAEPGRFYVARAFTLAANIIARRAAEGGEAGARVMYYINDGVYGSFNCILFDHQTVQPYVVTLGRSFVSAAGLAREGSATSSVWGPTCDAIDCVCPATELPRALDVGDWLGFRNMGAYTVCAASQFNGFEKSRVLYTSGVEGSAAAAGVRRALAVRE
ncbi:pyridoxal-dependent decarboxylase [Gautieria morchelliformis]|nr:pyridoxal-dependent decarboxylase [Gautieria morchelliformis]